MPKERLTTRHDARLAQAALSLAIGFIDSKLNQEREGGLQGQKDALLGTNRDVFEAIANEMEHGGEDVRGLYRLVRKIRSLVECGK